MKIIITLFLALLLVISVEAELTTAPTITNIQKNSYGYTIKFTVQTNTVYQVQLTANPAESWTVFSEFNSYDVAGTVAVFIPTASLPSADHGFFRVAIPPAL